MKHIMEPPKTKILIVDDDPIHISKEITSLAPYFEIQTAFSGYEALELIDKMHFDVVLLDINLGDQRMDGCKVMRLIRQGSKHKSSILVALSICEGMRDWYIKEGFDDVIEKPYEEPEFMEVIFNLLHGCTS